MRTPKEKSIRRFMDQVRQQTKRTVPLKTKELIAELTHYAGVGEYYKRAHVRKLFHRLGRLDPATDLVASLISIGRNAGWTQLSLPKLYGEYEACPLDQLNSFSRIPASLSPSRSCMRENRTCSLSGGRRLARKRGLLRPDCSEPVH